jgi:hypothetical protein
MSFTINVELYIERITDKLLILFQQFEFKTWIRLFRLLSVVGIKKFSADLKADFGDLLFLL